MAFEAFGATIDEWFEGFRGVGDHGDKSGVDPAACFDGVEAADDNGELHVEVFIEVLDFAVVRCDVDGGDAFGDEGGGDVGFGLPYVGLAEEELAIEI